MAAATRGVATAAAVDENCNHPKNLPKLLVPYTSETIAGMRVNVAPKASEGRRRRRAYVVESVEEGGEESATEERMLSERKTTNWTMKKSIKTMFLPIPRLKE
jgi:hypothetical protein